MTEGNDRRSRWSRARLFGLAAISALVFVGAGSVTALTPVAEPLRFFLLGLGSLGIGGVFTFTGAGLHAAPKNSDPQADTRQ